MIRTHSPHLLAFALARRPLSARYEPLRWLGQAEEVPVVLAVSLLAALEETAEAELRAAVLGD